MHTIYTAIAKSYQTYQLMQWLKQEIVTYTSICWTIDQENTGRNILECLKEADKRNDLSGYYEHTYCIYKEDKPKKETVEREEDGKKITETREIPGKAMLIEVITVDENGINIR